MGANDAVHPEQAEEIVKAATGGLGADVVLEMSGVPTAIHQAFALVRVGGRVQMLGIPSKKVDFDLATEVIFKGLNPLNCERQQWR
jgi:threonine 3-dehydrogenase